MGGMFTIYQLVQDFFHPQYDSLIHWLEKFHQSSSSSIETIDNDNHDNENPILIPLFFDTDWSLAPENRWNMSMNMSTITQQKNKCLILLRTAEDWPWSFKDIL